MPQDKAREVAERYDATADAYRRWWAPVLLKAARRLVDEMPLASARCIVDVGCGTGTAYPLLRELSPAATVIGLDRSHGMLEQAPAKLPRAVADARTLPLASACADAVLMLFMLFHLEQPMEALREGQRLLRGGGCLGSITWAQDMQCEASRIWTGCLDDFGADPAPTGSNHELVDTPAKVAALSREAGFAEVRAWSELLEASFSREEYIRLKTGVGTDRTRLQSLSIAVQDQCIQRATRMLCELGPEGFRATGSVVYAIAS